MRPREGLTGSVKILQLLVVRGYQQCHPYFVFLALKNELEAGEYNSQLLSFPDTSLDVNLGKFLPSRIPIRTNLCLSLSRGPSYLVTSHQRYSPLGLAFVGDQSARSEKADPTVQSTLTVMKPPRRVRMNKNDNLQQQRQQKATQTLVVPNMDSAIHRGLNHYPEDKYQTNQLRYPGDRDLSSGLSARAVFI